jgi:hypothetical protein
MQLRLFETLEYHFQKRIVVNLYESGIGEEFIALQLDLEIPTVISILEEHNIYKGGIQDKTN